MCALHQAALLRPFKTVHLLSKAIFNLLGYQIPAIF